MNKSHAGLLAASLAMLLSCDSPTTESTKRAVADPFRLVDMTRAAGLGDVVQVAGGPDADYIIDSLGCGAAWLDYDGDGDADLYLAQGATPDRPLAGPPDRLFRNDGDADGDGVPSFTDVTEGSGLGDTRWSMGVAAADYDNDGDPDIYLNNWGANRLYRNNGDGTFTDVAVAAAVADARWSVSGAWSDVDRDGDLDLYVTNYLDFDFERITARGEWRPGETPPCQWRGIEVFCGPKRRLPTADVLFRNDGDPEGDGVPSFTDVTQQAGLAEPEPLFGLSAHFLDGDGDGDDDLYVANDSVRNFYFVNRGDGTFDEHSVLTGLAYNEQGNEQAGMGVASADYNGDGSIDLAVTNFSHDHDTLYRNDGAMLFTDVSFPAGIGSTSFLSLGWGIGFLDLDHDGWEDLFVSHGHVYPQVDEHEIGTSFLQPNALFRNMGDGRFEDVTSSSGPGLEIIKSSRALLPVDLDNDGDLDLLITNWNAAPDLLRNDGAPGNWLTVRLQGTQSNRDGIGARVVIRVAQRTQSRQMRRETSYAGSTLPVLHFGIGSEQTVDRLEVHWPSGQTTVLEQVKPGNLIVNEPGGA